MSSRAHSLPSSSMASGVSQLRSVAASKLSHSEASAWSGASPGSRRGLFLASAAVVLGLGWGAYLFMKGPSSSPSTYDLATADHQIANASAVAASQAPAAAAPVAASAPAAAAAPVAIPLPKQPPKPVMSLAHSNGMRLAQFATDSAKIEASYQSAIDGEIKRLKAHPKEQITLSGHADERGTADYNYRLGLSRAEAVKSYMVKHGIKAKRIAIVSYGKTHPVDKSRSTAGYAKNRRVELSGSTSKS